MDIVGLKAHAGAIAWRLNFFASFNCYQLEIINHYLILLPHINQKRDFTTNDFIWIYTGHTSKSKSSLIFSKVPDIPTYHVIFKVVLNLQIETAFFL